MGGRKAKAKHKSGKLPSTPALRWLREQGADFEVHTYPYVARGGTRASSAALGVPEHALVKTLVFEDESGAPLIVLQHGDLEVSTKQLARLLGRKRIQACDPATARRHTGYQVGGTSPFATRKALPLYMEASITGLERIYINGGARGLLVSMPSAALTGLLAPQPIASAR